MKKVDLIALTFQPTYKPLQSKRSSLEQKKKEKAFGNPEMRQKAVIRTRRTRRQFGSVTALAETDEQEFGGSWSQHTVERSTPDDTHTLPSD